MTQTTSDSEEPKQTARAFVSRAFDSVKAAWAPLTLTVVLLLVGLFIIPVSSGVTGTAFNYPDADNKSDVWQSGSSEWSDGEATPNYSYYDDGTLRVNRDQHGEVVWNGGPTNISTDEDLLFRGTFRAELDSAPDIQIVFDDGASIEFEHRNNGNADLVYIDSTGTTHSLGIVSGWSGKVNYTWQVEYIERPGGTYFRGKEWKSTAAEPVDYEANISVPEQDNTGGEVVVSTKGLTSQSTWIDEVGVNQGARVLQRGAVVGGQVTDDQTGDPIPNATVTIDGSNYTDSQQVDQFGRYRFVSVDDGNYTITAAADDYFTESRTVNVVNGSVEDFQLEEKTSSLFVRAPLYLEHGERGEYEVIYRNQSENATGEIVTNRTTITSGNRSIVTIDTFYNELVATSNTSVNDRTVVTYNFTAPNGEYHVVKRNVTVANKTVNNLDILPPVTRVVASLEGGTDENPNDRSIMVILIATFFGVAATLIATSFAGVSTQTIVMIAGWLGGWVSNGLIMVTVIAALFIGLNVAYNIDYTTIR